MKIILKCVTVFQMIVLCNTISIATASNQDFDKSNAKVIAELIDDHNRLVNYPDFIKEEYTKKRKVQKGAVESTIKILRAKVNRWYTIIPGNYRVCYKQDTEEYNNSDNKISNYHITMTNKGNNSNNIINNDLPKEYNVINDNSMNSTTDTSGTFSNSNTYHRNKTKCIIF